MSTSTRTSSLNSDEPFEYIDLLFSDEETDDEEAMDQPPTRANQMRT